METDKRFDWEAYHWNVNEKYLINIKRLGSERVNLSYFSIWKLTREICRVLNTTKPNDKVYYVQRFIPIEYVVRMQNFTDVGTIFLSELGKMDLLAWRVWRAVQRRLDKLSPYKSKRRG